MEKQRRQHVAILHPDLGIGGAEMLIINLAIALESAGYTVTVYTSHFDPKRCFEEAKTLDVQVVGNWFPRSFFGRFFAFCAYIRMFICAIKVLLWPKQRPDSIVIDQISFPIPFLRLRYSQVLFYCHHPDKCLSTNDRQSKLKALYRFFLDTAEELTTACAKTIVVNSVYTREVFQKEFPLIRRYLWPNTVPEILYPSLKTSEFKQVTKGQDGKTIEQLLGVKSLEGKYVISSLNRYERKKGIDLALKAFADSKVAAQKKAVLVIAGGYDVRVSENVQHYEELERLAKKLSIEVIFLRSISNEDRLLLLSKTQILLYTPVNEHFGIVPVEAMYMGPIVLACNSGGPMESIKHKETGFLLNPSADEWTETIDLLLLQENSEQKRKDMFSKAQKRVKELFSFEVFSEKIDRMIQEMGPTKKKSK